MEGISYIGSLFKMLLALAVVLGLMVGTVYILKNILGRTRPGADTGEAIKILAVKSLGPRSSIMIIETLGKVTVVGVAGGQMQALTTVDDPEALAKIPMMRTAAAMAPTVLPVEALFEKARKVFKKK